MSAEQLIPLCYARDSAHHRAHRCPTDQNIRRFRDAKKNLDAAIKFAQNRWVMEVAGAVMNYKNNPAGSWKA
eukprot:7213012-Ditylum_brightwellii.AAC.1